MRSGSNTTEQKRRRRSQCLWLEEVEVAGEADGAAVMDDVGAHSLEIGITRQPPCAVSGHGALLYSTPLGQERDAQELKERMKETLTDTTASA